MFAGAHPEEIEDYLWREEQADREARRTPADVLAEKLWTLKETLREKHVGVHRYGRLQAPHKPETMANALGFQVPLFPVGPYHTARDVFGFITYPARTLRLAAEAFRQEHEEAGQHAEEVYAEAGCGHVFCGGNQADAMQVGNDAARQLRAHARAARRLALIVNRRLGLHPAPRPAPVVVEDDGLPF